MADNLSKYLQDSRLKYYRHASAITRLDEKYEEEMQKSSAKLLAKINEARGVAS